MADRLGLIRKKERDMKTRYLGGREGLKRVLVSDGRILQELTS